MTEGVLPVGAAEATAAAFARVVAHLDGVGVSAMDLGLNAPARPATLAMAEAARVPASLCALHALHDGALGPTTCLGLGLVLWRPLGETLRERPTEAQGEGGSRKAWAFAVPFDAEAHEELGSDEPPVFDDEDAFFGIDARTEEVVFFRRKVGWSVESPSLAALVERLAEALASGFELDDDGALVKPDEEALDSPSPALLDSLGLSKANAAPARPPMAASVELARVLVARKVLELKGGVSPEALATAIEAAIASMPTPKTQSRAVRAVLEGDLVDEVFADDDELDDFARGLVKNLG